MALKMTWAICPNPMKPKWYSEIFIVFKIEKKGI
jgi:hypothetical protein